MLVLSAVLALLGSWTLFPKDAVGMWAGYWVSTIATIAILGAMWLRSTLPAAPGVFITAIAGGVLALLGAARHYPTSVSAIMVAGGMGGIALGALMQTVRHTPGARPRREHDRDG